MITIIVSAWEI